MHCRISPSRKCNPCGYTMKISSRYHRLLIYDVKRTTNIVWVPLNYEKETRSMGFKKRLKTNLIDQDSEHMIINE